MENIQNKFSESIVAIIYIIIGLIMLVNPAFVCNAVNYIIGALIIIFGIIFILNVLKGKKLKELSKIELLVFLLCCGFGLFLMLNANLLVSLLPICAGILIFLDAFSQMGKGFRLKKNGLKLWYINVLVGLLFLAFSIFCILNASSITNLIVRFIGLVFVIDGILEIYTYFKFKEYNGTVKVLETEIVEVKKN